LGLVAQGPAHGYELHQRLAADLGYVWRLSLSQTYNILNRLEAKGFVTGTEQVQEKLPARRLLRLLPAGRQRFETWLHSPSGCSARAIRVEFVTRLYFAMSHSPALAHDLIEQQIAAVSAGLSRLQEALAAMPAGQLFNRLGIELRIRQLTSILDWLADCHTMVEPA
jgi:DNA-binding PadR family transcriptional regulator